MWDSLPQSAPGLGSQTKTYELLGLSDDHETDFEDASTPPPKQRRETLLAGQVLVADRRSASVTSASIDGDSCNSVSYLSLPPSLLCSTPR